jgi:hypothetical protein
VQNLQQRQSGLTCSTRSTTEWLDKTKLRLTWQEGMELGKIDVGLCCKQGKKNDLEGRETWKASHSERSEPLTRLCLSISVFRAFPARFLGVISYDLTRYFDRRLDREDYHSNRNKESLMEGQRRAE